MQVIIKPILVHEVEQLRQIAKKTFVQSYEHLNNPSNFQDYISKAFAISKLTEEIKNEECFYYLVLFQNSIIGYLKLNVGSSQTEAFNNEYLEVERIYLDANYHRKGIGKKMLAFAFMKGNELKKSKLWLGVWNQNPKAMHFYQQMGFKEIGTHIFKFGDEDQVDILMEIDIPF